MHAYYNDVNDWLTIGGDLDLAEDVTGQTYAETIDDLVAHGVTHVLDLRSEWEDERAWLFCAPAVVWRHNPVIDKWGHIPDEKWFTNTENFVQHFQSNMVLGDRLYMHCHMGVNRAPSAAMLALLTVDPDLDPYDAFMQIRQAREVAGVVYAEAIGIRHLLNVGGVTTEDLTTHGLPDDVVAYSHAIKSYWTPERREERRIGIAWYRDQAGGTLEVG